MKFLQQMAYGSDWGRFLYKYHEGYKAGAEQSKQEEAYESLWNETKDSLKGLEDSTALNGVGNIEKPFETNIKGGKDDWISSQIAKMLGESGTWGNTKDYPQTKYIMKELTRQGERINNPNNFIGKRLVIKGGKVSVEGSKAAPAKRAKAAASQKVKKNAANQTKGQPTAAETTKLEVTKVAETKTTEVNNAKDEALIKMQKKKIEQLERWRREDEQALLAAKKALAAEKALNVNQKDQEETKNIKSTTKEAKSAKEIELENKVVELEGKLEERENELKEEKAKVEEIVTKKEVQTVETKTKSEVVVAKTETPVETKEQKEKRIRKTVLDENFLEVETSSIEHKAELEPEIAELKKSPEQIADLNKELEEVNQEFASVKKKLQETLSTSFDTGTLAGKTPSEIEDLIKNNGKYENLYSLVKESFEDLRKLETQKKELEAVITVDALYDPEKTKSRYDVTEQDVLDGSETDLAKRYAKAEAAIQALGDDKPENIAIFNEINEGVLLSSLVAQAKTKMDGLAELDDPQASDLQSIQDIKNLLSEAREHGSIDHLVEEKQLVELLKKERRTSHMVTKENAEKLFEGIPKKYKEDISELTEKSLEYDSLVALAAKLSVDMTQPLNKETDPEADKKDGETWDSKHLDQDVANKIEALIMRSKQLEASQNFIQKFDELFPSRHNLFSKSIQRGKDKAWLSEEDVRDFNKAEEQLNDLSKLYGEKEEYLLHNDISRQGRKIPNFSTHLSIARENVEFRGTLMKNYVPVESRVMILDNGDFKFVEKKKSNTTKPAPKKPNDGNEDDLNQQQQPVQDESTGAEIVDKNENPKEKFSKRDEYIDSLVGFYNNKAIDQNEPVYEKERLKIGRAIARALLVNYSGTEFSGDIGGIYSEIRNDGEDVNITIGDETYEFFREQLDEEWAPDMELLSELEEIEEIEVKERKEEVLAKIKKLGGKSIDGSITLAGLDFVGGGHEDKSWQRSPSIYWLRAPYGEYKVVFGIKTVSPFSFERANIGAVGETEPVISGGKKGLEEHIQKRREHLDELEKKNPGAMNFNTDLGKIETITAEDLKANSDSIQTDTLR